MAICSIRTVLLAAIIGLTLSLQACMRCRQRHAYITMSSSPKTVMSAAEAIALANSFQEVLQASSLLQLPEIVNFPRDQQLVHLRKRQLSSTHALKRLCKFLIGRSCKTDRLLATHSVEFSNLVKCALYPLSDFMYANEVTSQDVDSYCDVVRAIGSMAPILTECQLELSRSLQSTSSYITSMASKTSLSGIEVALERLSIPLPASLRTRIDSLNLPFKLLCGMADSITTVEEVKSEVTFKRDVISTVKGRTVVERRETCWVADKGVGGLAYSGKIMNPVPLPPAVDRIRDHIEKLTGIRYDCALINLYPDGDCACKYHTDPDLGTIWSRDTAVVSLGETRRFNLRRIIKKNDKIEEVPHSFHVQSGDVVYMFGECQEMFQHCVMASEGSQNETPRISIVFKKSMLLAGGRRGHGISKVDNKKYLKQTPRKFARDL